MDLFHAREHIHDLARQLEFMLGDWKDEWLAARLQDLDYGDIDGICAAACVFTVTGAEAITTLRCQQASSKWEVTCNMPRTQTRTA